MLKVIDIYRGVNPPSHRFDSYDNPAYRKALEAVNAALEKLAPYNIPKEILNEIDRTQNFLTQTELELMWCFAFQEGMDFQKTLGGDVKNYDLSIQKPDTVLE